MIASLTERDIKGGMAQSPEKDNKWIRNKLMNAMNILM